VLWVIVAQQSCKEQPLVLLTKESCKNNLYI
jgi:hypothetical protein